MPQWNCAERVRGKPRYTAPQASRSLHTVVTTPTLAHPVRTLDRLSSVCRERRESGRVSSVKNGGLGMLVFLQRWAHTPRTIRRSLASLEILNGPFVSFSGLLCAEGAEVTSAPGFGILAAGVQPVLAGLQFANHLILLRTLFCLPSGPDSPN